MKMTDIPMLMLLLIASFLFIISCDSKEVAKPETPSENENFTVQIDSSKEFLAIKDKYFELAKSSKDNRLSQGDTNYLDKKIIESMIAGKLNGFKLLNQNTNINILKDFNSYYHFKSFRGESDTNEVIRITLNDFNKSDSYLLQYGNKWQNGYIYEDSSKSERHFDTKITGVWGYEKKYKNSPGVNIKYGIVGRFYVDVEYRGSKSIDQVKEMVKSMLNFEALKKY